MRRYLVLISVLLATLVTVAKADDQTPTQPKPKKWTFLIFLNARNNLDSFGFKNLNQLETIGSTEDVNIVVQWASQSFENVKRLVVTKDDDIQNVTSPIIEEIGKSDMGDWNNLVSFAQWGIEHYPAEHYFIDVWNHGSGWHLNNNQLGVRDISFDDATGHSIKTEELGSAMKQISEYLGRKIDVYGSDACLMAMAEVANEMSDSVSYFAGSEEVEPGDGWPYDSFIKDWTANPAISGQDLVKTLAKRYVEYYSPNADGSYNPHQSEGTFSGYDLSQMKTFNRAVRDLKTELYSTMNEKSASSLREIIANTTAFTYSDYKDLGDFVGRIFKSTERIVSDKVLFNMQQAMGTFVIANEKTSQYANVGGVALWIPSNESAYNWYSKRYRDLTFAKQTHWNHWLEEYYLASGAENASHL